MNDCCRCGLVAGKIKSTMLQEVLSTKSRNWAARHPDDTTSLSSAGDDCRLDGPRGLYVFKHRDRPCWQLVGRATDCSLFTRCSDLLKAAFDGTANDPLSALLVISLASDWDFYCVPVDATGQSHLTVSFILGLAASASCLVINGLHISQHTLHAGSAGSKVTDLRRPWCNKHVLCFLVNFFIIKTFLYVCTILDLIVYHLGYILICNQLHTDLTQLLCTAIITYSVSRLIKLF